MKLTIDLNIAKTQAPHSHGSHIKSLIVLHETVSSNYIGLKDIEAVSEFLASEDYGIHGITDNDGNIAWSVGHGHDIYYHTQSGSGNVNTRGIGIEQISRVMLDYRSMAARTKAWLHMDKEINATAKLIAAACRAHNIPIKDSDGRTPGITTHWEVTRTYQISGGHTDCWPIHKGGYYPKGLVIALAKRYYALGVRF